MLANSNACANINVPILSTPRELEAAAVEVVEESDDAALIAPGLGQARTREAEDEPKDNGRPVKIQ